MKDGTVLASNTSTISITRLAEALKRPENFCGMHFFNPVPKMPLVEVIRGAKSSPEAIATTVAYALAMGKTPIVVGDCAGFLVNRVLFPYFSGFEVLLLDGVDYKRIDKVMEKWGWPMGPALLLDVVGIDTGVHADKVMAAAFPDRMSHEGQSAIEKMVEAGALRPEERQGLLRLGAAEEGAAEEGRRPVDRGAPEGARDGDARGHRRGDRRADDAADAPRVLALPRGRDRRDADRGRHRARLRPRLPAVPRRDLPLGRRDGRRALLTAAESHAALGALYAPTKQLRTSPPRQGLPRRVMR